MLDSQQQQLSLEECFIKRGREEGLSVVEGKVWYQNPEGLNGTGEVYKLNVDSEVVEDVGLCEKTHLQLKIEGRWYEFCVSLGQILTHFKMPVKRYGNFNKNNN